MNVDFLKSLGSFHVLALDHRSSLLKRISPENLLEFKKVALKVLSPLSSAVLIDEDFGLKAYKQLDLTIPFLLNLEKSGHLGDSAGRHTELEHSASEVKAQGAAAAKLLIYYNHNDAAAKLQRDLVLKVSKESLAQQIPLVLEIIPYNDEAGHDTHYHFLNSSREADLIYEAVSGIATTEARIDIYKLPYPGSPEACKKITALLKPIPWVMLSGGDDFEAFISDYETAAKNGCKGFFAGRTLWKEALDLPQEKWEKFFEETVKPRLKQLLNVKC